MVTKKESARDIAKRIREGKQPDRPMVVRELTRTDDEKFL